MARSREIAKRRQMKETGRSRCMLHVEGGLSQRGGRQEREREREKEGKKARKKPRKKRERERQKVGGREREREGTEASRA